jgi:hypothetical protein
MLTPSVLAEDSDGELPASVDLPRPLATIEPGNSVAVPISRVAGYIAEALDELGAPQSEPFTTYVPFLAAQTCYLRLIASEYS